MSPEQLPPEEQDTPLESTESSESSDSDASAGATQPSSEKVVVEVQTHIEIKGSKTAEKSDVVDALSVSEPKDEHPESEKPEQEIEVEKPTVSPTPIEKPETQPTASTKKTEPASTQSQEPTRSEEEKVGHVKAKKLAEQDAELKYFIKLIDSVLLEIQAYSHELPETERARIKRQFEDNIKKMYKMFDPNAEPHDIALDHRYPEKLKTIEDLLLTVSHRTWPGEEHQKKRGRFVEWMTTTLKFEAKSAEDFGETRPREQMRDLLNHIRNARIDGHRERTRKHVGIVAAGILGAALGTGLEYYNSRPSAEVLKLQSASDTSESFVVETVQGRNIKIRLPQLPEGLVRYDVRAANPSDKIAVLVDSFDPVSGVLTLPNSVQPDGGSVHIQVQIMMNGEGKSVLSSQKTVDGVGAIR